VVELFTSQGCSSCPPADALLGRLSERRDVLAMSLPITYWDMLGWKDTLASPANTARQKAYAAAMGKGGVYTPQIVVDGVSDVVGSREADVDAAIAKRAAEIAASRAKAEAEHAALMLRLAAQSEARAAEREVESRRDDSDARVMKVNLIEARQDLATARQDAAGANPALPKGDLSTPVNVTESPMAMNIVVGEKGEKGGGPATVWLFHMRDAVTVNIGAGENDGRVMTYHNVVGDLRSVGLWTGSQTRFDVSRSSLAGLPHDSVAVVVQRGGYGRIVGATLLSHPAYDPSN